MQLPIDFGKRPYKPKYIDEETLLLNRWFIFGQRQRGLEPLVDLSDGQGDVIIALPLEVAQRLIKARNDFVDAVLREFNRS